VKRWRLVFAAAMGLLVIPPPAAHADDARSQELAHADQLEKDVERLYDEGHYDAALAAARQELDIRQRMLPAGDPKIAAAIGDVGAMELAGGDLVAAEHDLLAAAQAFEHATARDDADWAATLGNLAALYVGKNQRDVARGYLERAVDIEEKSASPDASALGGYYAALAPLETDTSRTVALYKKAIAVHEKSGPDRALVVDLARYADYLRAHAIPGSSEPIARAYDVATTKLGAASPLTAEVRGIIGREYWGAGQGGGEEGGRFYRQAYDALVATVGEDNPQTASLMQDWAVLKEVAGDLSGSLDLRRRADAVEDRQLARMLEVGTESDRLAYATMMYGRVDYAVELALSLGRAEHSSDAQRYALSLVLRRKGQVLDAITGGLSALRAHATPAEAKLLGDLADVRAKLATATFAGPGGGDDAAVHAYRATTSDLAKREHDLEAQVAAESARYRAATAPVTVEAVQAALPSGAALVEILRWNAVQPRSLAQAVSGGERYVAWLVEKDKEPALYVLGDASEIDGLAHQLRAALSSPGDERALDVGLRLNHDLLMRMEPELAGTKTLFVAPDDETNLVPFGALLDSEQNMLVRRYVITYLSSGRDLLRLGAHAPSGGPPAIFADPAYGAAAPAPAPARPGARGLPAEDLERLYFPPLPGTEAEGEAIAAIVPSARVLRGADATEDAVKAVHGPLVLHAATHGFFLASKPLSAARRRGFVLDEKPLHAVPEPAIAPGRAVHVHDPMLRSGIAFAGANERSSGGGDDGVLTALEAADLDLEGTRLVVLSACDTGVGDVRRGQGVFSMRRALVEAGAETQVMSLWEVDDDATKNLMTRYYAALFQGGLGRAEALQKAQLALLGAKPTAHPFYWAAFIVSGDPSPIATPSRAAPPAVRRGGTPPPVPREGHGGCGCSFPGRSRPISDTLVALAIAALAIARRPRRPTTTYQRNGQDVYYGIIPDLGSGGCQSGCGASSVLNNTTSVSSHEFAEAVTDPAVGLATVYGPPLGWYNATYGEIGDICNGQQATTTLGDGHSYTVQKLWSNKTSTCATP
jgi:CHAT domain-containing protein